jgi:Gluconate 2-dehydrogenase subunit 3
MWTRRKFIETSVLSQVALSSGILIQLYSCAPDNKSPGVLPPDQQKILVAAMEEIIPAADGMPSASEVGGLNYLVKLLEQFQDEAKKLSQGLNDLNDRSNKSYGKDFTEITSDERISVLQQLEKQNPSFFNQIRDYTYESYYLSPQVWKLIGYEPHPTLSSGPLMEPFDEKILDRVRKLPTIFKDV